jgi:hypothetical protein
LFNDLGIAMSDQATKAPPVREDGLQLEEHRSFQERFWTAERWAWVAFGLILLVALLGFTGSAGPFAHATASLAGGGIDYPRFARLQAPEDILVEFDPGGVERTLTLSSSFAASFEIEGIRPEPDRSEASSEGEVMTFRVRSNEAGQVRLYVRPQRPGVANYRIAIDDGAPVAISTIVLP